MRLVEGFLTLLSLQVSSNIYKYLLEFLFPVPVLLSSTYFLIFLICIFPANSFTVVRYCILLCKLQKFCDSVAEQTMTVPEQGACQDLEPLLELTSKEIPRLHLRCIQIAQEYYQRPFNEHLHIQNVNLTCGFWVLGLYWCLLCGSKKQLILPTLESCQPRPDTGQSWWNSASHVKLMLFFRMKHNP